MFLTLFKKFDNVAVEMIQMLGKKMDGLDINLVRMPWKRCKEEIKHNKVHGIFNASYKKSRLALGWYPTVDKTHNGPVDKSRRIIVHEIPNTTKIIQLLVLKRYMVAALQECTADSIFKSKSDRYNNIEKISPPLAKKNYYLMLSDSLVKLHPDLSQKIWDIIRTIRETKIKTITQKYAGD